jgi:hypothetical protein
MQENAVEECAAGPQASLRRSLSRRGFIAPKQASILRGQTTVPSDQSDCHRQRAPERSPHRGPRLVAPVDLNQGRSAALLFSCSADEEDAR